MPLQFVLQLNLDYVPHILGMPALPRKGTLFLFFESILAPTIFASDPEVYPPKLNGQAAKIIYLDYDASNCALRKPPPIPDYSHLPIEYSHMLEVEPNQHYEFSQKLFNFVVIDTYSNAWNSSFPGAFEMDPISAVSQRMRDMDDKLRQDLTDWRLEDEDTIEDEDDPTFIDTIFGSWGASGLPDAELFEHFSLFCPKPLEKDDILLFRFESLPPGEAMTFWTKPDSLLNQSFDEVFVWEEQP